ncbi:peptidase inhibitor family I36 protein [Streptomyces coeruleorubidus]|uniref:peptidase inhibitor family I36 protein n=1 Tax=Streptomyces coeruleorubidus TaxID=116188 RepID=UPI0033B35001
MTAKTVWALLTASAALLAASPATSGAALDAAGSRPSAAAASCAQNTLCLWPKRGYEGEVRQVHLVCGTDRMQPLRADVRDWARSAYNNTPFDVDLIHTDKEGFKQSSVPVKAYKSRPRLNPVDRIADHYVC